MACRSCSTRCSRKYGDTLPHGYMIFDHSGQRSMWLRIEGKTMKALDVIGDLCIENNRTVDDVIGGIVQIIAKGELKEEVDALIAATPQAKLPKGAVGRADQGQP